MVNVSIRWVERPCNLSGFQSRPERSGDVWVGAWACKGPVAQLGERLVCIQEVVGSNPVGSTTARHSRAYSSVWLERTPDKREVGGSNPPRPTS